MAYTVKFENGQSVDFESEPSADDIEEVAASFNMAPAAPAEKPGMLGEIGRGVLRGIPKAGATILGGVDFLAGGLAGLAGDTESADAAFRQMEERNRSLDQFNEENLPVSTTAGKVAQGVTQAVPMLANPGLAMAGMSGMTGEQIQGLHDQGVDPETAKNVGLAQMAANIVLSRIGLGASGGYLKEITANMGAGGAANWLSQKYLEAKGYDKAAQEFDPTDAQNWMTDFLAAVLGTRAAKGAAKKGLGGDKPSSEAADILKSQEQPTEAPTALPEPVAPGEPIPTRNQAELGMEHVNEVDTEGVRNPYDIGGDVTRQEQGLDTTLESPQGDLFSPEGRPMRPEVFDEPKTMEGLAGLDNPLEATRPAADTDIKSPMVSWFKTNEDGTVNLRDTLRSLLTEVKSDAVFPGYKALANRMISYLEKSGVTVRVVDNLDQAGLYRAGANEVLLRRDKGNNNYVLMHELVHAATSRWMRMNMNHPLVKQLRTINDTLRKEIGEEHYGVKDEFELLSEVETNPLFADRIKESKVTRNLWERLKDTLDNLRQGVFKIAPKEYNALQRALDNSAKIMGKQEAPGFKWDASKAFRNPEPITVEGMTGRPPQMENAARGVVNKPETSNSDLAIPVKQNAAMAKVPGLEGLLSRVSKDIPIDTIKQKIMEVGDITNSLHGAIGSKEMIASIKNHPAIYWVGQMYTNARKRAELYHAEYLRPLEKEVLKLAAGDKAGKLAELLKAEMFAKSRMTEENMRKFGLSDKEIEVYNKFRTEFDRALDRVNEYRLSTGQDPVTPHEAYIASRWRGDWKTPVYDKKGRLVWYIAETSKAKADHALKWLADNEPDIDVGKSKVKYTKDFFMTEESMNLSTYKDMVAILGTDDPLVQHLKALYENKVEAEAEGVLGHKRHFEPKAGIRGFQGDRPWANSKENVNDLFKSQLAYLRNAHTWVEMQSAMRDANKVIGDPAIVERAPNLVELLQDIKRNEMGYATHRGIAAVERSISKFLGHGADALGKLFPPLKGLSTDLQSLNHGLGMAKAYFYVTRLGMFNVPFALVSTVQPVFTVPHHVQLSGEGYKHNPVKTLADSVMYGTASLNKHLQKNLPELQKEAIAYMEANGIGDLNQFSEANDIGHSETYHKIKEVAGWSMSKSEKFARSMAFMGYVSHLEQSGKFKGDQHAMFQKAEELTNKSMANYRHTERAGMFNKTGFTGNALATLNTFKVNQYNQLYDLAKTAKRTGNYKPLMSLMGMQMVMAGALGMYAIDEIEDLYNYFKMGLIETDLMKDKDYIEWSPKHAIAQHLPDWASYGLFSKAMGSADRALGRDVADPNYSSRMSAGNIVDLSFSGMFPFASDYAKQIGAAASAAKNFVAGHGTKQDIGKALTAMAPSSIRPMVEMSPSMGVVDEQGNPKTSDGKGLAYRRTPQDLNQKMGVGGGFAGMQSTQEHKTREEAYRYKRASNLKSQAMGVQADKFETAVLDGNAKKASSALRAYIDLGGDDKTLMRKVEAGQIRKFFTEDEWRLIQSKGTGAMRELADRLEYKGVR